MSKRSGWMLGSFRVRRWGPGAGVVLIAAILGGCSSPGGAVAMGGGGSGPYQSLGESSRDVAKAERLTREAAGLLEKNPAKAEQLLREALTADLYHGPAHNNLGVLHMNATPPRLYEAASEFEWARKLMPGHPDPRVNLALTLEMAGRTSDAMETYETALEIYPEYLPAMQGITSLQMRGATKPDERTRRFLSEIALRAPETQWREWARAQLMELDGSSPPPE